MEKEFEKSWWQREWELREKEQEKSIIIEESKKKIEEEIVWR